VMLSHRHTSIPHGFLSFLNFFEELSACFGQH
jgi:hypothetical protein